MYIFFILQLERLRIEILRGGGRREGEELTYKMNKLYCPFLRKMRRNSTSVAMGR